MTEPLSLHPIPFTPRRKLFAALSVLFALWVAGMLWMYFATVYPQRHGKPTVSKDAPIPLRVVH